MQCLYCADAEDPHCRCRRSLDEMQIGGGGEDEGKLADWKYLKVREERRQTFGCLTQLVDVGCMNSKPHFRQPHFFLQHFTAYPSFIIILHNVI